MNTAASTKTTRFELVDALPFDVNLRRIQDICFDLIEKVYRPYCSKAARDDAQADRWVRRFRQLGEKLRIRLD